MFAKWRDGTPEDFVVAVKMSRYLTHIRRLRDPAEPVARFLDRAAGLGDSGAGAAATAADTPRRRRRAERCCAGARGVRVAVEPRHRRGGPTRSATLERHGAALCWADRRGRPVTPLWRTADFGYLRLHEGRAEPRPRYGRARADLLGAAGSAPPSTPASRSTCTSTTTRAGRRWPTRRRSPPFVTATGSPQPAPPSPSPCARSERAGSLSRAGRRRRAGAPTEPPFGPRSPARTARPVGRARRRGVEP